MAIIKIMDSFNHADFGRMEFEVNFNKITQEIEDFKAWDENGLDIIPTEELEEDILLFCIEITEDQEDTRERNIPY